MTNLEGINFYFNELREIEKSLKECFIKREFINNYILDLRDKEKNAKENLDAYSAKFLQQINSIKEVSENG